MSIHKISSQTLNAFFTLFDQLDTRVFWLSSVDYKRQLYINRAYAEIWKRPCEALQAHPELWVQTLVPEDLQKNSAEFKKRGEIVGYSSTIGFRIHCPDGKLNYLKSTSFTLVDKYGQPAAIAGIDELISADQWQRVSTKIQPHNPFFKDFIGILQQECNLLSDKPSLSNQLAQADTANISSIIINNQQITFSKREKQCLHYLLQGFSAKQTAYELHLSTRTIEAYLAALKKKVHCRTKIALIRMIQNADI